MKIKNLRLGNIYYISIGNMKSHYTYGELIEILSTKRVLIKKKDGSILNCNVNKLHTSPDKAVVGRKAKVIALQDQNKRVKKEKKGTIDKSIQNKIVQLGKNVYSFKDKNEKYIICGFNESIKFDTIEDLQQWLENQLLILEDLKQEIKQYKYMRCVFKDGSTHLYAIIGVSFKKFEIRIRKFEYIGDIEEEKVLDKKKVKWRFKIIQN